MDTSNSKYVFGDSHNLGVEFLSIRFPDSLIAKDKDADEDYVRCRIKEIREKHSGCHLKEECRKYIDGFKNYYLICETEEFRSLANYYKQKG
jgi:hypothetical protein